MTEFELATIALSFIVGFGVTAVLSGVVDLLTRPRSARLDWMPLSWAAFVFVEQVNYWFGVLFIGQESGLTVWTFWSLILLATCLFLAGALILPANAHRAELSLIEDFDRFGRRALIPYSLFQFGAVAVNVQAGVSVTDVTNVANAGLGVAALIVFVVPHRTIQRGLTVLYGGALGYGLLFWWSRPGAVG